LQDVSSTDEDRIRPDEAKEHRYGSPPIRFRCRAPNSIEVPQEAVHFYDAVMLNAKMAAEGDVIFAQGAAQWSKRSIKRNVKK
jgi:hypothetical protein